ncbi:MAG: iron-sulfur cluster assembly accessory protein [Patescibacteria group bacterium]
MDEPQTPITLTDAAAAKLIEFRDADEKTRGKPLRLAVQGGGCAGFNQVLYFDDPKPDIDQVFDIKGLTVLVDSMSLMYLAGTELDYVDGLNGTGFTFNNPNVKSTCGCGSSFSP